MVHDLLGDDLDAKLLYGARFLLEYRPTVSPTALARIMQEDFGYQQFSPIAAGQWLKKTRCFSRARRSSGNVWKPRKRKLEALLDEFNIDWGSAEH